MEAMSLSVRVDAGVIEHNNRNFIAKNVNKDKVADNISYVKKDIKEMYQELFSEALNKYNAKQTRSDRVIKDYYEHIVNGNQEKPFYEAVIQFGNMDNAKVGTEGGEIAKKMLDEYMKNFQKRNPNLVVFNAVMHLDEATPHLHISFIPVAHNQSRGLETRVSLKKALEELNVSAKTKKLTERQQWAAQEKEVMKTIAKKFGLGIENKNIHRQHLSVEEYKVMQDEMKAAQKKLKTLYEKFDISSKKLKEDDMNLILNNTKLLKKELEEKDKRIMDLEKKVAADFVFLKVGDEQKISFVCDELRKEGVNVVDDLEGIHVPQYAANLAREIGKNTSLYQ